MYSDADTLLRYLETSFAEPSNPIAGSILSSRPKACGRRAKRLATTYRSVWEVPCKPIKTVKVSSKTDFLDI